MKVFEIMVKNPVTVSPETSIRDAARTMLEKSIGSLIISKDEKPLGILTERDLVRRVLAVGRNPESTKVFDVCSKPVVAVSEFMEIDDAVDAMNEYKIRRLVIINNEDKVTGIITTDDIGYNLRRLSEALAIKYITLMRRNKT